MSTWYLQIFLKNVLQDTIDITNFRSYLLKVARFYPIYKIQRKDHKPLNDMF